MHLQQDRRGFLLQITSLEELRLFVALVCGEVDEDKIREMTQRLKTATDDLEKAETQDGKPVNS